MIAVFGLNACHDVVAHTLLIDGKPVVEAEEKQFSHIKRCTVPGASPAV